MFCYSYEKKRSGLYDYQDHRVSSKDEKRNVKMENIDYVKRKKDYKKHVDLKYPEIKIRAELENKKHAIKEKVNSQFELHEIRQVEPWCECGLDL